MLIKGCESASHYVRLFPNFNCKLFTWNGSTSIAENKAFFGAKDLPATPSWLSHFFHLCLMIFMFDADQSPNIENGNYDYDYDKSWRLHDSPCETYLLG